MKLPIIGGITIAIASSLLYLLFGVILGISGMINSLIKRPLNQLWGRKFHLLCGIIISPIILSYLNKKLSLNLTLFETQQQKSDTRLILLLSGTFVGLGTRLANGCTSGHGLCGLARLSLRSYCAVLIFLTTAIITATLQLSQYIPVTPQILNFQIGRNTLDERIFIFIFIMIALLVFIISCQHTVHNFYLCYLFLLIGIIFGSGLLIGGMSKRSNIIDFLTINSKWNPSLLFVLASGVLFNLIVFTYAKQSGKSPMFSFKFQNNHSNVNLKLIIGSILFGIGWGLGGLCPGPLLLLLSQPSLNIVIFWGIPFLISTKIIQLITTEKIKLS